MSEPTKMCASFRTQVLCEFPARGYDPPPLEVGNAVLVHHTVGAPVGIGLVEVMALYETCEFR